MPTDNRRRLSLTPHELRVTIAMMEHALLDKINSPSTHVIDLPTNNNEEIAALIDKMRTYLPTQSDTLTRLQQRASARANNNKLEQSKERIIVDPNHPDYNPTADPNSPEYINITGMVSPRRA